MASSFSGHRSGRSDIPKRETLPAQDIRDFRARLKQVLRDTDEQGRIWASSQWGVYAFYDYDGEPIYVGQTNERLSVRVQRHLTNQRTDAVAMRILDVMEVAEVQLWPLWDLPAVLGTDKRAAQRHLDAVEYTAYLHAIDRSRFRAILNEKVPSAADPVLLPPSRKWSLVDDETRRVQGHPDIRIARRAETISRLADVARERGEVSDGLRRVIVIQAVRLAYLAAGRLAFVEGRVAPDPSLIDAEALIGADTFRFVGISG